MQFSHCARKTTDRGQDISFFHAWAADVRTKQDALEIILAFDGVGPVIAQWTMIFFAGGLQSGMTHRTGKTDESIVLGEGAVRYLLLSSRHRPVSGRLSVRC